MNKILSIIIPTYNMEALLPRCLDSLIIAENFEKLEIWVVNDGSKDRSSEIGHEYEAKYPDVFKVIDKPNGNYGSCINAALPKCTGKYVKVLDADDWFDTYNLNQFIKDLSKYDVDLVITDTRNVDIKRNINTNYRKKINCYNQVVDFKEAVKCPDFLGIQMHFITYRTTIFNEIDYHQTEGISYTDQEWIFSPMIRVRQMVALPYVIYNYLIGREGQTMDSNIFMKSISHQIKSQESRFNSFEKYKNTSIEHKTYLLKQILSAISLTYSRYLNPSWDLNIEELVKYDCMLKRLSPELYRLSDDFPLITGWNYRFIHKWRSNINFRISIKVKIGMFLHRLNNKLFRNNENLNCW